MSENSQLAADKAVEMGFGDSIDLATYNERTLPSGATEIVFPTEDPNVPAFVFDEGATVDNIRLYPTPFGIDYGNTALEDLPVDEDGLSQNPPDPIKE